MAIFQQTISNNLTALGEVAAAITAFVTTHAVPAHLGYQIDLAVEELLTNIIKYGYNDAHEHAIEITLDLTSSPILTLRDDGRPFDPTAQISPRGENADQEMQIGGWGLSLVRKNSQDFSYRRDGRFNEVRLTF